MRLPRWFTFGSMRRPAPPAPPAPHVPPVSDQHRQTQPQPFADNSARIHIATNDPEFPGKREAAISRICAAISDVALPVGYKQKGTTWSRTSSLGRSAINLQRSRYGFSATINLRFVSANNPNLQSGDWADGGDITLSHFKLPHEGPLLEDGDIFYLDVCELPFGLELPIHILANRALPWLEAHHTASGAPTIADHLMQCL